MQQHRFFKVQGTGNDFVFLDLRGGGLEALAAPLAARLCDRRFGIGADGVLVFHDVRDGMPCMRIFNADGSVAEMCGNGLRCFVRVLSERLGFPDGRMAVLTDSGVRECSSRRDGERFLVCAGMGPIRDPGSGGLLRPHPEPVELLAGGRQVAVYQAVTGNPHAVLPGRFAREEMERIGPALAVHPHFPNGTNVEFLDVREPRELHVVVCERSVGFTLACGTGAVAAAAVAVALGASPPGEPLDVRLPGGTLGVTIAPDFSHSKMEGPAEIVFEGAIELPAG